MVNCRKTIAFLLTLALVFLVTGSVISNDSKDDVVAQWENSRSASKVKPAEQAPAGRKIIEQQKYEEYMAALENEEEPTAAVKPSYSNRNNFHGAASIAGHSKANYDPRTVYFTQDFEGPDFPPAGWDSVNTDPGYGFFLGTYSGGGTQAALVTWHGAGFIQDEWMISPTADLSAASSDVRLEFWFLKGYDYPHDFKVYVATDGVTFNLVWDSDVDGAGYPSFTWTQAIVDMSAFMGESSVTVGFQYYGEDADLFGLDDVILTDSPAATGRCCSGDPFDPTCTDGVTLGECDGLGGSWMAGGNCTDNPCPIPGEDDDCSNVTPQSLPYTFTGNNEAATFDTYCQYFADYPNVWFAFTIEECSNVTLSYCGTQAGWGNGWLNLVTDCACPDGSLVPDLDFDFGCPNGNPNIYYSHLPAGTYYYPVMLDPANGASGDFSIDVSAEACPPAPDNDECDGAEEIGNVVEQPFNTTDATLDGAGFSGGPNVWYCYTATCDGQVTVSLCGSLYDTKLAAYEGCVCEPLGPLMASNDDDCGLQSEITFTGTTGQQYLIEVGSYGSSGGEGLLSISCEIVTIDPGDVCEDPLKIDLPPLPYSDLGQTTCDRGDDYNLTCLGLYDGGEDIIYEVTVISEVTVDITLDPLGTTYTGILIDDVCPPSETGCIGFSSSGSSSDPHGLTSVILSPGVYYIMVDTWPSPDCIPAFDLHITEGEPPPPPPENDDWENAEEIGDVVDYGFCTDAATFDGPGATNTCPNVWYCYTASCDGNVTISLCNSEFDTRLTVYDGCGEPTSGNQIAYNDDACGDDGYKSEVEFAAVSGNTYMVEIGGYPYSSGCEVGCGQMTISCSLPCEVECPVDAFDENEPCGSALNEGCNSEIPAFTDIACGQSVCGNTYFDGDFRDTDWYRVTLDGWYEVSWTVQATFDALIGPVGSICPGSGNCEDLSGVIDPAVFPAACEVGVATVTLGPGVHYFFVAPLFTDILDCSTGPWTYWASLDCVPAATPPTEYCDASSNTCDEYIANVTVGDINNTSGCSNYEDYTGLSTTMELGNNYPISVTNGNTAYSSDQCGIWVDWNQDGDFCDVGETFAVTGTPGTGPYTATLTPSSEAVDGPARLRVRITYTGAVLPCGTTSYGEVEDYTIIVQGATPSEQLAIDPDPIYPAMGNTVSPQCVSVYLGGEFAPGYDVNDVNTSSLLINGLPAVQTEVIGSYPDFVGDVLEICVDMRDFVRGYGVLYNTTSQPYSVEGEMGDATPFLVEGELTYVGHVSGDVNLDGSLNVLDLNYLINYIFRQGSAPQDPVEADLNADGFPGNILDLNYMINFIFRQGPAPLHLEQ